MSTCMSMSMEDAESGQDGLSDGHDDRAWPWMFGRFVTVPASGSRFEGLSNRFPFSLQLLTVLCWVEAELDGEVVLALDISLPVVR